MKKNKNSLLSTDRLMAFSDGVFAIAITILILEIKIPKHEDLIQIGGLYAYLIKIWPSYLSYIISFIAIGIYWSNHHWLFTFIHKSNHTFNLLNIVFLMAVSFMPFSTAIMGDFILYDEYANAAVTMYCIGYLLPIIPIFFLYNYAVYKRRLVPENLNQKFINRLNYKLISGFILMLIAFGLSFHFPKISLTIVGASWLLYFMPPEKPLYDENPPGTLI